MSNSANQELPELSYTIQPLVDEDGYTTLMMNSADESISAEIEVRAADRATQIALVEFIAASVIFCAGNSPDDLMAMSSLDDLTRSLYYSIRKIEDALAIQQRYAQYNNIDLVQIKREVDDMDARLCPADAGVRIVKQIPDGQYIVVEWVFVRKATKKLNGLGYWRASGGGLNKQTAIQHSQIMFNRRKTGNVRFAIMDKGGYISDLVYRGDNKFDWQSAHQKPLS